MNNENKIDLNFTVTISLGGKEIVKEEVNLNREILELKRERGYTLEAHGNKLLVKAITKLLNDIK